MVGAVDLFFDKGQLFQCDLMSKFIDKTFRLFKHHTDNPLAIGWVKRLQLDGQYAGDIIQTQSQVLSVVFKKLFSADIARQARKIVPFMALIMSF
ncbi:hypothetical protein D3C75_616940 [compost metagenome]